jgi:hypothetical protein
VTPKEQYDGLPVYNNTKVYNLLFSFELNRRLQARGITNVMVTTAHPGISDTNLNIPMLANSSWFVRQMMKIMWMVPILVQTPEYGALPKLYAAVGENIKPNDFIGPDGFQSLTGYPIKEDPVNVSKSEKHAAKLWEESEKLVKLKFTI